jgi:restriction endonuclease Mrr
VSFPKQNEIELPLLKALHELGGKAEPKELYPRLAKIFTQLTPEDLTARLPRSPSTFRWHNLVQYEAEVKRRIISELQSLRPTDFEQFCISFLGPLGYQELHVTKRGADGGIDGHGLFRQGVVSIRSAFQAKRWRQNPVSRPEIDKFRGAIQGDYDHGVFLTTERFTADAEAASIKKGAISLLLLDGDSIAENMIRNGIGVLPRPVQLFDLAPEFFRFPASEGFF